MNFGKRLLNPNDLTAAEFCKPFDGRLKRFVLFTETESNKRRPERRVMIERRTRNRGDTDLADQVARKFDIILKTEARYVGHHIIRAFGHSARKTRIAKRRHDHLPLSLIIDTKLVVIFARH